MKAQVKMVTVPILVMLLVTLVGIVAIETYIERQLEDQIEIELQWLAAASLEAVKTVEDVGADEDRGKLLRSFQTLAANFSRASDVRITYMDANGRVLGDSDLTYEQLEHLGSQQGRVEVQEALEKGIGVAEHYSNIVKQDMLYVAVRSNEEHYTDENSHLHHPLIARASRPMTVLNRAISDLRLTLTFIGVLIMVAVLVLGLFASSIVNRAVAGEQRKLEERVEIRTNEISILQTFGSLLNSCSTLAEAAQVMESIIPKLMPGVQGSVSIIKSSRNRLDKISNWGGEWLGADKFAPSSCWALRKGQTHFSAAHDIDIHCNHWGELDGRQTLCIPLLAQGETIGVLHFVMRDVEVLKSSRHLWNAVAEQIGLTMANIQLRDSLREQAIRDPLTGLYNQGYMMEALEQAMSRADRTKSAVAILMMDLDHFKRYNDNFGHDAGDYVLKSVANVVKESTRLEDILCRYGGEEFCIICTDTEEVQATLIAERICKSLRSLELSLNNQQLGVVTASIGIALYPNDSESIEAVLKLADEALYVAKQSGRDRVVISQGEPAVSDDAPVIKVIKSDV